MDVLFGRLRGKCRVKGQENYFWVHDLYVCVCDGFSKYPLCWVFPHVPCVVQLQPFQMSTVLRFPAGEALQIMRNLKISSEMKPELIQNGAEKGLEAFSGVFL